VRSEPPVSKTADCHCYDGTSFLSDVTAMLRLGA
jgi:hypothetical protein